MKNKIIYTLLAVITALVLFGFLPAGKNVSIISDTQITQSINKSLPLLQKSGNIFINATGCASCHNNTMTAMTTSLARKKGIPVIDSFCEVTKRALFFTVKMAVNTNTINEFISAKFIAPYVLLGLHAEQMPADFNTDIAVDYMLRNATVDGHFQAEASRVPLEAGDIHLTALNLRAIQLYAPPLRKAEVAKLVARSRNWLEKANPDVQQEMAFQLLGLQWTGSSAAHKQKVINKIKSLQRADGGWSQLPTMQSDAYATGQCLYALFESGMVPATDEAYQKGLNYLLKTQDATGAWIVKARCFRLQPFTNSEFPPYDKNQFISAAATNWALLALLNALPDVPVLSGEVKSSN